MGDIVVMDGREEKFITCSDVAGCNKFHANIRLKKMEFEMIDLDNAYNVPDDVAPLFGNGKQFKCVSCDKPLWVTNFYEPDDDDKQARIIIAPKH